MNTTKTFHKAKYFANAEGLAMLRDTSTELLKSPCQFEKCGFLIKIRQKIPVYHKATLK